VSNFLRISLTLCPLPLPASTDIPCLPACLPARLLHGIMGASRLRAGVLWLCFVGVTALAVYWKAHYGLPLPRPAATTPEDEFSEARYKDPTRVMRLASRSCPTHAPFLAAVRCNYRTTLFTYISPLRHVVRTR